jgi:hypothetical protein
MREIAIYELQCLMDDGADADEIDEKLEQYERIQARRDSLERYLAGLTATLTATGNMDSSGQEPTCGP